MGMIKSEMIRTYQKQKRLRRGGKNTKKNCAKKVLMFPVNSVVWSFTQSQTSWSVKSSGPQEALSTNKVSGNNEISAELFKILKDNAIEVLHSICQQIWKTQQWPWDWKNSVLFQSRRRAMSKNVQATIQLCSFLMLVRLCSKSFKLNFNSM